MIRIQKDTIYQHVQAYFKKDDMKKAFSLLWPYIVSYRIYYFILLFLLLVDIALTLLFAWIFGTILDAAVQSNFARLKQIVPLACGLTVVSIIYHFMDTYIENKVTSGIKRDLKIALFKHILLLRTKEMNRLRSGELLSYFTTDIHSINGVVGRSLMNLIRLPLIYVAALIYLCNINWTLTILNIAVAPLAVLSGLIFGSLLRRNSRVMLHLQDTMHQHVNETFTGLQVIRSFTLEKLFYKKFTSQNTDLYTLELQNTRLSGSFFAAGQAISSVTFLISLCLGALFVFKGTMTAGTLLIFMNLVNYLIYPLTELASQWASFQRAITSVERLTAVFQLPTETATLSSYTPIHIGEKDIHFQNITFSYDGIDHILQQFNLHIQAGKTTAIVGLSGAGKTTLFQLLQGFYEPQQGTIALGHTSIKHYSVAQLRSSIAHVSQEPFLFRGTIRENLQMAKPDVDENTMIQATTAASIHDFIMTLPKQYDTEVGERGVNLSGGQRQRLAIARAILKDAPILLLDEATSALDNQTEETVKKAIDRLMKNRTTLIIAHRLSTIQNADIIVVMDNGDIVQTGTHEELMRQDGLYRELYANYSSTLQET
ncbi:ABC transporter ATP-binding protein/permease [Ectobacillus sp. JY-23]|uniref:ABC transporter ATP-binding protein n=1 Tax=Ectobacillus sp. JY-23 TaxID=2933872 RepID=UPI001FF41E71|nr:ABC transporter ATP-binding protein [Ectobacillus sp. JY-23]UOY93325.1 ABC transporter ATP-binding protein/permease [Ectobacillus sp. JY-23]